MLQSYLLDGVAGAALLVFATTLRSRLAYAAGIATGSLSLVQAAVGSTLANRVAATHDEATIRALFDLLNTARTLKLVALALLIGAASRALPRWLAGLGAVAAPGRVVGGARS